MKKILIESLIKSKNASSKILEKNLGADFFIKQHVDVFKTGMENTIIKGYEFVKKHN